MTVMSVNEKVIKTQMVVSTSTLLFVALSCTTDATLRTFCTPQWRSAMWLGIQSRL